MEAEKCLVQSERFSSEKDDEDDGLSTLGNLKMKISQPRFLSVGMHGELDMKFPACLEKKSNSELSGADGNCSRVPQAVFLFPEDISIHGETPLSWPLWLHAVVPGNISLYITIYYEMGDTSSIIKYRTLRMYYNLQGFLLCLGAFGLPSLAFVCAVCDCLRAMAYDGYIGEFEYVDDHRSGKIVVELNGRLTSVGLSVLVLMLVLRRSKLDCKAASVRQFGYIVLTTSAGIMDHEEARRKNVGGKVSWFLLLC
ncbi:hypothetical protein EZV62_028032 [Acer yangbiense]|uniref:Uncharacterized protein n=1 Tax=Acer yangbiense TaxID=1000413 RepID=A0A5C7GPP8_9ROSI|nr:hypothetical protein EZV62_028032 [Acer yangbiense]